MHARWGAGWNQIAHHPAGTSPQRRGPRHRKGRDRANRYDDRAGPWPRNRVSQEFFYDLNAAVKHTAANVLSLDRVLARYGPETAALREALKLAVAHRLDMIWPRDQSRRATLDPSEAPRGVELLAARIRGLAAQTDEQRWLQSRALQLGESLLEARWLVFAGLGPSVPVPFLSVLLFWLTITFASFGLFAPRNATVVSVLCVCALSVAGAVFLVLEMDGPFEGLITVSADPLTYALAHLNQ
jgi:hypothetical protein